MSLGHFVLGLIGIVGGAASVTRGVRHLKKGLNSSQRRKLAERRRAELGRFAPTDRRADDAGIGKRKLRVTLHNVKSLDDRMRLIRQKIQQGKLEPEVIEWARKAVTKKCGNTWCVPEKDTMGEAKAIFDALRRDVRYTSDILGADTYARASQTLKMHAGDCFPEGTRFLTREGVFLPVELLVEGDTVHDGERWVRVLRTWERGPKKIIRATLNNGSVLRLSDTHKVLVVPRGGGYDEAQERVMADLRLEDELLQPRSFDLGGTEDVDADDAFLIGAYLAEGCRMSHGASVALSLSIAGVANSKGIRERVIEILTRRQVPFKTYPREVRFGLEHFPLALGLGRTAGLKALQHLNWSRTTIDRIVAAMEQGDGGLSTSGSNMVYSTISNELAMQYRVLKRAQGHSTGWRTLADHGGAGQNPIHRLTVRVNDKMRPWARVSAIEVEEAEVASFDIMTESGRVYLPAADVITRQCDDYTITGCSALNAIGIPCASDVIQTKGSPDWNHVYALVGVPRVNPTRWVPFDASVDRPFGWEAPRSVVARRRRFRF